MNIIAAKSIDIEQVADRLGLDVNPRTHKTRCISPNHNDRNPSLSFDRRYNYFKCFGCDLRGDVLDLIQITMGFDFRTAYDWLMGDTVLPDFPAKTLEPPPTRLPDTRKLQQFYDLLDTEGDFLAHKGLSAYKYGVRAMTPEAHRLMPEFPDHGLIIPYYQHGELTWLRWRNTRGLGIRFLSPADHDTIIYNQDALGGLDGVKPLYLAEGETDTMSLSEMGHVAIGFPGATQYKLLDVLAGWVQALEGKIPEVICAFDDDVAGNSLAFRVASLDLPVPVSGFDLQGYKDVNELFFH